MLFERLPVTFGRAVPSEEIRGRNAAQVLVLVATLVLSGCEALPARTAPRAPATPPPAAAPPVKPSTAAELLEAPIPVSPEALRPAVWNDLPGWRSDDPGAAWSAFVASCSALANQAAWHETCTAARGMGNPDRDTARRFFESNLAPFRVVSPDGSDTGLITGYYEPLLRGSRKPNGRYRFPVYGVPDDLLVIDLGELYPELKGLRLRGRLDGRRVLPYFDRGEIEQGRAAVAGKEIIWVDDPVDLFFLQVQGSGRIALESGESIRVGYADQNGHPYRSIGRLLVERGELPPDKASMQGIREWARANPDRLTELLNHNARYVFFQELPAGGGGPPGALGVALTPRRSIAVDPRFVPLGAPVYIATTWPLSDKPLNELVLAQDTGGAIRGAVRADLFWGFGDEAAREAGRMKQPLRMWVLLPKSPWSPYRNE